MLIGDLAGLFQICYAEIPTERDREVYQGLLSALNDTNLRNNPDFQNVCKNNVCKRWDDGVSRLGDHAATIALFDTALSNRSEWPDNDSAVKQVFTPKLPAGYVHKSGWGTTSVEGVHME